MAGYNTRSRTSKFKAPEYVVRPSTPIGVAVGNNLAYMVDGVGYYINPPEPQVQPLPPAYDRYDQLFQRIDQRFDQLEQQQQSCFTKLLRKPMATFAMFITGILLVIGATYLFHFGVLSGCLYSQKELAEAIARQDYGTMELYSQQVSRLCSLNNKLRLATFDYFGRAIDGISPTNLVQQVLGSVFGFMF